MASVQKGASGFGVVWSLGTSVSGTGVAATSSVQSVDFAEEADTKDIKGADGATKCKVFSDQRQTLTIEVVPTGATIAAAKLCNIVPALGADITITDADDAEVAASTWICTGASKRKTIDGEVRITMNLVKHGDTLSTIAAS